MSSDTGCATTPGLVTVTSARTMRIEDAPVLPRKGSTGAVGGSFGPPLGDKGQYTLREEQGTHHNTGS